MFNLIINNGSASKKYALYKDEELLFNVHYERVADSYIKTEWLGEDEKETDIDFEFFKTAFSDFIKTSIKNNIITSEEDISKIGLRVVAPSTYFQDHHIVDDDFMEILDIKRNLSPLHIKPVQEEISDVIEKMPKVDMYAISDSAFHRDKPTYANIYAYPKNITKDLELYRFGYHGISVSSIVQSLRKSKRLPENLIVCHLGGGSSITAVKNGRSIDNTMGYSPLEGLPMATRIGNADPNSLFAIMDELDLDVKEIQNLLYKECGSKGISGVSGDTREILKMDKEGNKDAKLALDYYAYEIKKFLGAYATILGGLDMIVFTGTIGNRSADVRNRICDGLDYLGVVLDKSKNKLTIKGDGNIESNDSKVELLVLKTDEMKEMNRILIDITK